MSMKEGFSNIILALLLGAFVVCVATLPAWILWNWLMPIIFGLPKITIWQSFGLIALAHCIFPTPGNKE